jgi:hypothetical protein
MENETKFIHVGNPALRRLINWFISNTSKSGFKDLLQKIYAKDGVLVASDGYSLVEWDLREVHNLTILVKNKQVSNFAIKSLKELNGIFDFKIHGHYLVITPYQSEKPYPDFSKIGAEKISFTEADYEDLNLEVARIYLNLKFMKRLASIPIENDGNATTAWVEIGGRLQIRADFYNYGSFRMVAMPIHNDQISTVSFIGKNSDLNDKNMLHSLYKFKEFTNCENLREEMKVSV